MKTQMFEDELYYVCHDGKGASSFSEETKNRLVTPRRLRCMAVLTAGAANTKQNVFINMNEKNTEKNKSMKINEQWEVLKEESH